MKHVPAWQEASVAIDRRMVVAALAARIALPTRHVHSAAVERPTFIRGPDLSRSDVDREAAMADDGSAVPASGDGGCGVASDRRNPYEK